MKASETRLIEGQNLTVLLQIGGPYIILYRYSLYRSPSPPTTYGAQTAAEMWKQLSDVKEPKGIHGVVNTYRAIFRTYANKGDSIIDHISKLCTHRNTLSTLGALIPDKMFTILVSASLPDSWDSFTRSYFGNKVKAIVTSQELIGLVVDEAKRLAMREKETDVANQTRPFNNCHEPCTATGHVTSHNCAQTSHTCI